MTAPSIRFHLPDERLRPFFTAYYHTELPEGSTAVEDWLPLEWPNLRFALRGRWEVAIGGRRIARPATVFGPTSREPAIRVEPPALGLGVGLLPLGWAHLVQAPAADFADRAEDMSAVFGDAAQRLLTALAADPDDEARVRRLDAFFLHVHERSGPAPEELVRAHAVLNDPTVTTAEQFAAALGVSPRHAVRLSLKMFGFPPKLLLRRQRFLRTLAAMREHPDRPWTELLDEGYYDQSHLVRDFRRFAGMTPSAYFAHPRPLIAAAAPARARALGFSLMGLQPPAEVPDQTPRHATLAARRRSRA